MAEADLERLRSIATRTWMRTLDDDRLGFPGKKTSASHAPRRPSCPCKALLSDKPEHLFERPDSERIADDPWGSSSTFRPINITVVSFIT